MVPSIAPLSSSLKAKALAVLCPTFIATVARSLGLSWRQTPLALPHLIALFARQILGGNLSMPELARQAGSRFTPEAFCIARGKLPLPILRQLLEQLCQLGQPEQPEQRWKGHRLWHLDGTGVSMPDTPPLQQAFGQPGEQRPGCGFPVAHLLCLFDAASGLIHDLVLAPLRTHDLAGAAGLHPYLRAGDLLIADRAFESFAHLALLKARGVQAVLPAHQKRQIDFRRKRRPRSRKKAKSVRGRAPRRSAASGQPPLYDREVLRKCGPRDHIVRWRKPPNKPAWLDQAAFDALPQTLEVRELRRVVEFADGRQREVTLVSTLTDEKRYPAEELVQLLQRRWAVEVNLRHLKTTMKMEVLRSQTVAGVERELWMYLIVYNAVRLVMLEAAAKQQVSVDRLSFADALYWVRHGDLAGPLPALQIVPYRPDRVEPRAVKRRPKEFDRLNRPRAQLRKRLLRKGIRR